MQILYQLLSVVVVGAWAFVFTFGILKSIDYIPFIRLRLVLIDFKNAKANY